MSSIHATKVLGLTSGSSLDGVNASIIVTDGVDIFETISLISFVIFAQTIDISVSFILESSIIVTFKKIPLSVRKRGANPSLTSRQL